PSSTPDTSNGVAPSVAAISSTLSGATNRNSASGSTKCLINHGHATRSTFTRSRVIHFISPRFSGSLDSHFDFKDALLCRSSATKATPRRGDPSRLLGHCIVHNHPRYRSAVLLFFRGIDPMRVYVYC